MQRSVRSRELLAWASLLTCWPCRFELQTTNPLRKAASSCVDLFVLGKIPLLLAIVLALLFCFAILGLVGWVIVQAATSAASVCHPSLLGD